VLKALPCNWIKEDSTTERVEVPETWEGANGKINPSALGRIYYGQLRFHCKIINKAATVHLRADQGTESSSITVWSLTQHLLDKTFKILNDLPHLTTMPHEVPSEYAVKKEA
jgi:hypothetical protein